MKASELAKELIKHPDYEVEFVFFEDDGTKWYRIYSVDSINVIWGKSKNINLTGVEK